MNKRRKLIVGNWKMNGSRPANAELLAALVAGRPYAADVAVCVPAVFLTETAATLAGSDVRWGAQDVSAHQAGAYTGEISAAMLHDCGCRYAIVGHSERRAYHCESDLLVAQKAQAALSRGVTPIVCVGETLQEREAGHTEDVVKRQLSVVIHQLAHCVAEMVVAYEPVWAIGTGRTATPEQAQAVHAVLRAQLQAATGHADTMKILYGGSVKADNAATLFAQPDIDGGLIGGASLKATEFIPICRAAT
ncbi:MAG TPA: triose-phosphate isomerase [Rubrivivax sp.]|nr:triose-phosphate isomerase [Rubrivivax sp.]